MSWRYIDELSRHHHRDEAQIIHRIETAQRGDRRGTAFFEIRDKRGDEEVEKLALRGRRPASHLVRARACFSAGSACPDGSGAIVSMSSDRSCMAAPIRACVFAPAQNGVGGPRYRRGQRVFGRVRTQIPNMRDLICFSIRSVKRKIPLWIFFLAGRRCLLHSSAYRPLYQLA